MHPKFKKHWWVLTCGLSCSLRYCRSIWSAHACSILGAIGQNEPAATNAPVGRSVHWMGCVFSFGAKWGSSQSLILFSWLLINVFYFILFLFCDRFPPGPDLTPSYSPYFPTLISTAPTLISYLLSPTDIPTLITRYPIDLTIVLTMYLTNLVTLLITYPTNITTVLTSMYPLRSLPGQALIWRIM